MSICTFLVDGIQVFQPWMSSSTAHICSGGAAINVDAVISYTATVLACPFYLFPKQLHFLAEQPVVGVLQVGIVL